MSLVALVWAWGRRGLCLCRRVALGCERRLELGREVPLVGGPRAARALLRASVREAVRMAVGGLVRALLRASVGEAVLGVPAESVPVLVLVGAGADGAEVRLILDLAVRFVLSFGLALLLVLGERVPVGMAFIVGRLIAEDLPVQLCGRKGRVGVWVVERGFASGLVRVGIFGIEEGPAIVTLLGGTSAVGTGLFAVRFISVQR